ncbi:MAG: SDR family NAD(P)-dependent oxidoreductase [Pseudomonadota bacterium]
MKSFEQRDGNADMKKALIIGGSRGLGFGLVEEKIRRGWHVTTTERTYAANLRTLAENNPQQLIIENLDIRDQAQQRSLADRLSGQSYDLLFLNAGILLGWGQTVSEIADADIADKFLTNAISPVRIADLLFDQVRPGGMVAFMSSILGSVSRNDDGRAELYRASKAALNSLVLSFCARHSDADRTVLLLHPGVVQTDMGGANAPLDIATSVTGLASVIEQRWGQKTPAFVDYQNNEIPW